MPVRLYSLDADGSPVTDPTEHAYVEDAQEAAQAQRGAELQWGDTQLGYEGMTEAEGDALGETGDYPPLYFQIVGLYQGNDDELGEEDHRPT